MAEKIIQVEEKDYHLFETYGNWEKAHKTAREIKEERGCKYFILKIKEGGILSEKLPSYKFALYFNKKLRVEIKDIFK